MGYAANQHGTVKAVEQDLGEVDEVVFEQNNIAFSMQLQALEFMAAQERVREKKYRKRQLQRGIATSGGRKVEQVDSRNIKSRDAIPLI